MRGDPEAKLRPWMIRSLQEVCGQYGHNVNDFYSEPGQCACGEVSTRPQIIGSDDE